MTSDAIPLLAFGAHPDDIEFGCGGVIALETRAGRGAHMVVCSRGEAASHGTPEQRAAEAQNGAALLGATMEFAEMGGDAHLEASPAQAIKAAAIIRRVRPRIVLAPTTRRNQHPDHAQLGELVRDAARLARYGGIQELAGPPAHTIEHLLFYSVMGEDGGSGSGDGPSILVDVSDADVMASWKAAMGAHGSQTRGRAYVDLQLTRARLNGLRAGVGHAIALTPNDPLVVNSLASLEGAARAF
jgi:N-acetylglucosamine malate deacetylase 1